jgi:hypothetical protein
MCSISCIIPSCDTGRGHDHPEHELCRTTLALTLLKRKLDVTLIPLIALTLLPDDPEVAHSSLTTIMMIVS